MVNTNLHIKRAHGEDGEEGRALKRLRPDSTSQESGRTVTCYHAFLQSEFSTMPNKIISMIDDYLLPLTAAKTTLLFLKVMFLPFMTDKTQKEEIHQELFLHAHGIKKVDLGNTIITVKANSSTTIQDLFAKFNQEGGNVFAAISEMVQPFAFFFSNEASVVFLQLRPQPRHDGKPITTTTSPYDVFLNTANLSDTPEGNLEYIQDTSERIMNTATESAPAYAVMLNLSSEGPQNAPAKSLTIHQHNSPNERSPTYKFAVEA